MGIEAIIFDKDGTLFDFHRTWSSWARGFLLEYTGGDRARAAELGALIGYDMVRGTYAPDSVVIAGTNADLAAVLAQGLGAAEAGRLTRAINSATHAVPMAEAVPLVPLLGGLRACGLRLGVATNDAEAAARAHLAATGIDGFFEAVLGYDSGHGGKPAPGMLLAMAQQMGLAPARMLMVGDSTHDLVSGRAAGMATLGVLTGIAEAETLAPHADAVLPDIGHLAGWLEARP